MSSICGALQLLSDHVARDEVRTATYMIDRIRLRENVVCKVLPEGVVLATEDGSRLLTGRAERLVACNLDGSATLDEIIDRLEGDLPAAEVCYVIEQLTRDGFVVSGPRLDGPDRGWEALGAQPQTVKRLRQAEIEIVPIGAVSARGPKRSPSSCGASPRGATHAASVSIHASEPDPRGQMHSASCSPTITCEAAWPMQMPKVWPVVVLGSLPNPLAPRRGSVRSSSLARLAVGNASRSGCAAIVGSMSTCARGAAG